MKSELGFLMDLFLDEDVPEQIKRQVAKRIREVENSLTAAPLFKQGRSPQLVQNINPVIATQSPSMQRIMEANPDILPTAKPPTPETPAAAAALQHRAAILANKANEKPEPGRTGPRKF